jgi:hypothetical protein
MRQTVTRRSVRARTMIAVCAFALAAGVVVPIVAIAHSARSGRAARVPALVSERGRFALLRAPAGTPIPPSFLVAVRHVPAYYGLEPSSARETPSGTWLIPGVGGMCLALSDSEGIGLSCTSTTAAEAGELRFSSTDTSTGEEQIVGIAPDGASSVTAFGADGAAVDRAHVADSTFAVSGRDVQRVGFE